MISDLLRTEVAWVTHDITEVWLDLVGSETASQNYASAASSVLATWLISNSQSVRGGSWFR